MCEGGGEGGRGGERECVREGRGEGVCEGGGGCEGVWEGGEGRGSV